MSLALTFIIIFLLGIGLTEVAYRIFKYDYDVKKILQFLFLGYGALFLLVFIGFTIYPFIDKLFN